VRLGLVLAKVGEQNAIAVSQDEVNRALAARARQFPGQEKQVIQYYTSNPQAMAELRVPLFEDKVVDFLGELIQVEDRKVPREILFLDPDEAEEKLKAEGEAPAAEASAKKPQAAAKKAEGAEEEEAKPAKKTRAKAKSSENDESESKPKAENKPKAKKKKEE
jgi:trigger factor